MFERNLFAFESIDYMLIMPFPNFVLDSDLAFRFSCSPLADRCILCEFDLGRNF